MVVSFVRAAREGEDDAVLEALFGGGLDNDWNPARSGAWSNTAEEPNSRY